MTRDGVGVIASRPKGSAILRAALPGMTHDTDRYPVHLPEEPVPCVAVRDALGARVAPVDGEVAGRVLVCAATTPEVMAVDELVHVGPAELVA